MTGELIEKAILAGGCFWGVQDLIRKLPGVVSTRVGYTGGDVPNATYRHHGNHAEAIEITFRPQSALVPGSPGVFFQIHDPTTKNRQGNDIGTSYRSAIFYTSRCPEGDGRGHDRECRRLGAMARESGYPSGTCGPLLGGRA